MAFFFSFLCITFVTIGSVTANVEMGWSQVCVFFFYEDVGFGREDDELQRREKVAKMKLYNKGFHWWNVGASWVLIEVIK